MKKPLSDLSREELATVARAIVQTTERQANGCLCWTGGLNEKGYGRIWTGEQYGPLQRAAWIVYHGPIADGLWVCHTCDVPPCIEPSHLFLGTHDENMADMVGKSRQPLGERNGLAVLTADDAIRIYTMDCSPQEAADLFNVSRGTIRDIRNNRTWAHVTSALGFTRPRYATPKHLQRTPIRTAGGERRG